MHIRVTSAARAQGDFVVLGGFEGERPDAPLGRAPLRSALARALAGWDGAVGRRSEAPLGDGRGVLSLQGLGERGELTPPKLRQWLAEVVQRAEAQAHRRVCVVLPDHPETHGRTAVARVVLALRGAAYRFDRYLTEPGRERRRRREPSEIAVVPPRGEERAYRREVEPARIVADAVAYARDLANTPPNIATPRWLASQARALARRHGMRVTILGPAELRQRGMGGILAVGGGSANPPRLVRLRWGNHGPKVALVGKGVTFDTGGISIKPAASMEEMKYDKCGACTALAIAGAAAELRLQIRLEVVVPLAENMPSGTAYRPSDIVRCYNGKTVEIQNTDAEGRMLLADALALAAEGRPAAMLDFATLTGACVVALGDGAAGLFTADDGLSTGLLQAAADAGERLWRLPLWPEFVEQMKGEHADLKNSGGRWGGANTAAGFLSQFTEGARSWAHVDLAGPAYTTKPVTGCPPGATGYGVALTVEWLRSAAGALAGSA